MSRTGRNAVVVDTSAHYALADDSDANHQMARALSEQLRQEQALLLVTNFIVAETYGLLLLRLGRHVAFTYVGKILEGLRARTVWLERVSEEDEVRAWKILETYADQDFSYVDATTFAVMERLGVGRAFAFDRHFDIVRLKGRHPLTRLP